MIGIMLTLLASTRSGSGGLCECAARKRFRGDRNPNFTNAGTFPPISLCPSVDIITYSLVKCNAFDGDEGGMRRGGGG